MNSPIKNIYIYIYSFCSVSFYLSIYFMDGSLLFFFFWMSLCFICFVDTYVKITS
ncbi:uncharacterized protein BX663DRAFT_318263 [Cokeromyces recurvatus]|uniref:uncharacterized protein n=1 Tax=Cokeromyces recurvatus TaxID=90255 RepID=UPI00221FA28B|nr:uncharacterized protein BX663DRAFT_318263 [Cokeromyces recurvatus]KAI7897462.1 hypothetical protein BX663DRAFT_318263 [Cokeromyces recurvatus]